MCPKKYYIPNIDNLDPEFIRLQNKWYKKLKDEGFKDIEWLDSSTGLGHDTPYLAGSVSKASVSLNEMHDLQASQASKDQQNYYRICSNYAVYGTFPSKTHRKIFEYHASGLSYRKIARIMTSKHRQPMSYFKVFYIVKALKEEMFRWNNDPGNEERVILD